MYLEQLDIQGFKSFAHKTTLEFKRGIAAVVGPNGSGKSNIADAIRWVLGEQSLKLLRGKKSEDVIFAGSDKKTKLGAAEVTLTLDNREGKAAIDYDKFSVTRRVYKDGTSEYLVNGAASRLGDIQMLLAKSNIGQRTYSVIGQNMVDAVLVASPRERKEFFDEAAGVRPHQMKREQAEHKLAATRENLAQAQLLIDEIHPRLRSLTRQVKRLGEREEIQKGLRQHQVGAYTFKLVTLRDELEGVREKVVDAEKVQETALDKVHSIQKKLDLEERGASRQEAFTQLQRTYQQLVDQRNRLLTDRAALAGKIAATMAQAGQSNVAWLTTRQAELESQLAHNTEDQETLRGKLQKLDAQVQAAAHQAEQLATELKHIEGSLLKAEHALKTRTTMTLPDLAKEVTEVVTHHQKFLGAVRNAATPEEFAALKREAQRLESDAEKFIRKVQTQAPSVDPAELLDLQHRLHDTMKRKEVAASSASEVNSEKRILDERFNELERSAVRINDELVKVSREFKFAALKPTSKTDADTMVASAQAETDAQLAHVDTQLAAARKDIDQFNHAEQTKRDTLFALQKDARHAQDVVREAEAVLADFRVEVARLETREEDALREIRAELPAELAERVEKAAKAPTVDLSASEQEIAKAKHALELIGGIDDNAQQEYKDTNERYTFLTTQVADLTRAAEDLEVAIQKLEKIIKERFEASFEKIATEFSKYFKTLFNGGHASIELVKEEVLPDVVPGDEDDDDEDEDEMLSAGPKPKGEKVVTGVEIYGTPPGKRLKGIAMLSGGERALTSIALICAILASNPSPFVVLDEVDAALDESNSIRFAQILEKLAHKTQFITITHNRATMQRAALLYGVTMGDDGVSKLLSVKMEDVDKIVGRG
ncbi:MAG: chromosome segregation SMC family protein [Patescibacteria group bacterium]